MNKAIIYGTLLRTILSLIFITAMTCQAQDCPPVKVILQPFDFTVCNSGNAQFYIVASDATSYQWEVNFGTGWVAISDNSTYQGVNKDTLQVFGVTNGMNNNLYRCKVINGCSNATSFPGALIVAKPEAPTISIEYLNTSICTGVPVGFIAKTFKQGPAPIYQWKINGINAGSNTNAFVTGVLKDGDVVTCELTSNATCITSQTAFSNSLTIQYAPTVLPQIQILEADTVICQGSTAPSTFTVLAINGGVDPDFQWQLNSKNTGVNSNILSTVGLTSGDTLRVIMTSKDPCASPKVVRSKDMILDVSPLIISSIQITTPDTLICEGEPASYKAFTINQGAHAHYEWMVNGNDQHHDSVGFTTRLLKNADIVSCRLTSTTPCFKPVLSNDIMMKVVKGPSIIYPTDTLIIVGGIINLSPIVKGNVVNYDWEPSIYLNDNHIQNPISTPLHTVTYTLKSTSSDGCVITGKTTIQVIDHVHVPNIFTPNNDGINDKWEIVGLSTFLNCKVQVFDRYGQLVYNAIGYNTPWDGSYKGKALPGGTYYYVIETKTDNKLFTGFVTLLR